MCGIVAAIGAHPTLPALDRIVHRGPDGRGECVIDLGWTTVALGMVRLAIVDRRPIPVPYRFASCGVTLAYNGEIFNWRALRHELSDGAPWETECDAEVLARAWRRWGAGCLARLNGMFAFVLVDELRREVFVARDRAGEKPLYVDSRAGNGTEIAFASEAKAFANLIETPCADLVALEADFASTPLRGVVAFQPATSELYGGSGARRAQWWSLPMEADQGGSVEELTALVTDAVRLRAADGPLAVQLSGGLDSAIIQRVALAERLYCVTFPEINNVDGARAGADGRAVIPITFTREAMFSAMGEIAWHLDTPATWTAACQWFMAREMAQAGVRVALSGEGADELFGGYTRYRPLWWLDRVRQDRHLDGYAAQLDVLLGGDETEIVARLLCRHPQGLRRVRRLVEQYGGDGNALARAMRMEFHVTLPTLLRMADRMTMAHGIEGRAPFLDFRIMEYAGRLRMDRKVGEEGGKLALRAVAQQLGVPSTIVQAKTKRGLAIPWFAWRTTRGEGARGAWDRAEFAEAMLAAWRGRFFGAIDDRAVHA